MSKLTNKREWIETFVWAGATLFVALVRIIYFAVTWTIHSNYMAYAWVAPLAVFFYKLAVALLKKDEGPYGRPIFNAGASSVTVYLLLTGVYEMANTVNASTVFFLYFGIAFILIGLFFDLLSFMHKLPSDGRQKATESDISNNI
jgi:hypothetical protein